MATGDTAAAAGLTVFPASQDARLGYNNDNVRGDELGAHMLTGTHTIGQVTGLAAELTALDAAVDSKLAIAAVDVNATATTVALRDSGGRLIVQEPTGPSHTATKNYVDAAIAGASTTSARYASGPTSASYARTVSGSGFFAVWMDAGLEFGRNVSARKYKEDIAPHQIDPAACLLLQPVTYHRIGSPEGEFEFGLIADDVQEVLPEVVTWFDGEVDGIRYDLLAVALLSTVQDQDRRLGEALNRITALEARLDDLAPTTPEERA